MITKVGRKKYRTFAFDIESHNDEESIAKGETSMWLGCFIDESSQPLDEENYFYTMDDFIDHLQDISYQKRSKRNEGKKCQNILIYIYNLSFEWSFILPVLLRRGIKWTPNFDKNSENEFTSISTKSCSSVWEVKLKFKKTGGEIIFRDLAKIYGGGLGNVAKAFNLPTQKGEIDYRLNRLHNYKVTEEEKIYCFKDVRIIIDILLKMTEKEDKDFFNVSSMASYSMKKLMKVAYPRSMKPYREFRKEYPELSREENEFLRQGVEGGITYAPSRWQFKEINQKVLHIDAHQMHPSQMYMHLFPYGRGEYFKGKPTRTYTRINCCRIKISYGGVKLHSIIKLIGLDFIEDKEIVVWDFEIPTMKKVYEELEIEYIDGYSYACKPLPWRKYMLDNYKKRLVAKKNKDAFFTLYYKLLNNSSYGKFLEKPHLETFENYINIEGIIDSKVREKSLKDSLNDDMSEEEFIRRTNHFYNAKYTYLPVGSAIPAYSRVMLIETALKFGWENVVYFDTDSIFCIYNEFTKKVWESEAIDKEDHLGGWGLEEISDRSQFTAPKRYKLETNGVTTIRAGGINFDAYKAEKASRMGMHIETKEDLKKVEVGFDEINIVSSSWKVQRAYRVKGGTIIEFQNKEMRVPKKYESIYLKNTQE